jgi:TRAP-type C4-dicarboxylate transport system substrate-binding protein
MTSNKKIEKIDDFKGIKIRTMENANHIAFWKALSANPTPMAFGEVYIGLQQGTIDGLENPYEGIATSKFYEQQKYLVDTNHVPHLVSLIMSKKIYDSLASSDQELIIQAAQEARDEIRKESDEIMAGRINTIKEGGVTFINLTPEDRKIIREKVKDVNEKITDEVGIDFVAALRKASQ